MKRKTLLKIGLIVGLSAIFSITNFSNIQAVTCLFDQTFFYHGNRDFNYMTIEMRILVCSNQHVECYVSYYIPENQPPGIWFEKIELWVRGHYWEVPDEPIVPANAYGVYQYGYAERYGDLEKSVWENGQLCLDIVVGLKFHNVGVAHYASQALSIWNFNGRAIALIAFEDLSILSYTEFEGLRKNDPY
ncbi:MAG: hypothetical protein K9W46_14410 [Candidatus Heimdallarchaeum endolithica]|uniref:Uncharacterized protein n=1 Tax=Candidatus Heimdallarchaeum endolithica TaxID=2876572 RepID=A0A9Y1BSI3_9ARCH|nr:MAG: hypothetical protein K9W46_14410 [Candidatus Heimdallarchaeum endolithica]